MRKIRELIRLKYEARLSHGQIARALAISKEARRASLLMPDYDLAHADPGLVVPGEKIFDSVALDL